MRITSCIRAAAAIAAIGLGLVAPAPAQAASLLEKNFGLSGANYDGDLPSCEAALNKIAWRFASKEWHFWNSNAEIIAFENVREIVYRPWAQGTIPRRFCTAVALVNDGLKHKVSYSLIEDGGMIGQTWGVEWCVDGFDRNWAFNPRCKMARP